MAIEEGRMGGRSSRVGLVCVAACALALAFALCWSHARVPSAGAPEEKPCVREHATTDAADSAFGDADAPSLGTSGASVTEVEGEVGASKVREVPGAYDGEDLADAEDAALANEVSADGVQDVEGASAPVQAVCSETAFRMPEGASFESQTVLVDVAEGADLAELVASVEDALGPVEVQIVSDGIARVRYAGGRDVEQAINDLLATGEVEAAQPNYAYTVMGVSEEQTEQLGPFSTDLSAQGALSEEGLVAASAASQESTAAREDFIAAEAIVWDGSTGETATEADGVIQPIGEAEFVGDGMTRKQAAEDPGTASGQEQGAEGTGTTASEEQDVAEDIGVAVAEEQIAVEEVESAEAQEQDAVEEVESAEAQEQDAVEEDATVGAVTESAHASAAAEADASDEAALLAQAVSINDPKASEQWALKNLKAYDAWSYAKAANKVTVAVMDLGCQVSHPDLKANVVSPYNAYNAVYGGTTGDVTPVTGSMRNHGTHVAGIVAATANNGVGVAGVSYNANVMPIKVVDSSGTAYTDVLLKAYDYVIARRSSNNVRVINLSMGMDAEAASDDALLKKVDQAYNKGIVTVAAAGNRSASKSGVVPFSCYPSDHDKIVSVMNLEQSGTGTTRAATSNYNASGSTAKNICAPGTSILSCSSNGDYVTMSGTSMAAPQVSGVLALEFAANARLSAQDAVTLLFATATNVGSSSWSRGYGWGKLNAAAAAKAARDGMTSAQRAKARDVSSQADALAAKLVTSQIAALPTTANLTLSHASKVTSARKAYDALTSSQQALVTNISKLEAAEARIAELKRDDAAAKGLTYRTHVQREGWQAWKTNGAASGTTGRSLRLEAIQIKLGSKPFSGTIQYQTHVQTYGWESAWRGAGTTSGTTGQSKRLEAIRIRLTGQMASHYDIYYRVHAQRLGWMGWAKNGASAGTAGYSYRLEAIQVVLVPKGGAAPAATYKGATRAYTKAFAQR